MDAIQRGTRESNEWKINRKFVYCSIYKSIYTRPVWENLTSFLNNSKQFTALDFYTVLSSSMIYYLFQWKSYKLIRHKKYINREDNKYIDAINNILNHFTNLVVSIIWSDNSSRAIYKASFMYKIIQQNENLLNKISKQDILKYISDDDTEKYSNVKFFDDNVQYFDGTGTVLWLWIHISAAKIVEITNRSSAINNQSIEFYNFFSYLKYFLWCPTCLKHYNSDVYPKINTIDRSDMLKFTIKFHELTNKNTNITLKFNINDLMKNDTNLKILDFYDSYINFWKD